METDFDNSDNWDLLNLLHICQQFLPILNLFFARKESNRIAIQHSDSLSDLNAFWGPARKCVLQSLNVMAYKAAGQNENGQKGSTRFLFWDVFDVDQM